MADDLTLPTGGALLLGLRSAVAAHVGLDVPALLADPASPAPVPPALPELVDGPARTGAEVVALVDGVARRLVLGMETLGWEAENAPLVASEVLGSPVPEVVRLLRLGHARDGGHPSVTGASPTGRRGCVPRRPVR